MKLISWNIRQGGGDRLGAICAVLATHDPDVVVLSEVRMRSMREIGSSLQMKPRPHLAYLEVEQDTSAVCVLSKEAVVVRDFCPVPIENVPRWLDVDFPSYGFGVAALYIPRNLGLNEVKLGGGSKKSGCGMRWFKPLGNG